MPQLRSALLRLRCRRCTDVAGECARACAAGEFPRGGLLLSHSSYNSPSLPTKCCCCCCCCCQRNCCCWFSACCRANSSSPETGMPPPSPRAAALQHRVKPQTPNPKPQTPNPKPQTLRHLCPGCRLHPRCAAACASSSATATTASLTAALSHLYIFISFTFLSLT